MILFIHILVNSGPQNCTNYHRKSVLFNSLTRNVTVCNRCPRRSLVRHTFSLCSIFLWCFDKFASVVFELLLRQDFDLWPDWDLDLRRRNLNRAWHTFSLCFIFLWSVIKFASVVYEQHNFRHNLTFDLIVTLTLGLEPNSCAWHTFSLCSIFLWSFDKFAWVVFELLLRQNFDLWPDCDLDLGGRNLTLVRDTPSHYVLSFCEVSSNLLQ